MTHSQNKLEPSREAGKRGCVAGAPQSDISDAQWLNHELIRTDAFMPILTFYKTAKLYEAFKFL